MMAHLTPVRISEGSLMKLRTICIRLGHIPKVIQSKKIFVTTFTDKTGVPHLEYEYRCNGKFVKAFKFSSSKRSMAGDSIARLK